MFLSGGDGWAAQENRSDIIPYRNYAIRNYANAFWAAGAAAKKDGADVGNHA